MSEADDLDDLPLVTFTKSANDKSTFTFVMPSAIQLAKERADEEECERKLEMLRQQVRAAEQMASDRSVAGASEGELALTASVSESALKVRAKRARVERTASAADLWAALAPHLPPHAVKLHACLSAPAPQLCTALTRAVYAVAGSLVAPGSWPDDELQCAAALLSVGVLARESRCRHVATRALHALLDDHASPDQVHALADVLLAALPAVSARLLLSDALRSGAATGADRAAALLTSAAALQLLRADTTAVDTGARADSGADTPAEDTGARADSGADTPAADTGARADSGAHTPAEATGARAESGADTPAEDTGARADSGGDTPAEDTGARADSGADTQAEDTGARADSGADTTALDSVARAAGAWRSCDAPSRYVCVQLAGRLLAAADRSAPKSVRERLLAHLTQPLASARERRLDLFKTSIRVTTLKHLFGAKNSFSGRARP